MEQLSVAQQNYRSSGTTTPAMPSQPAQDYQDAIQEIIKSVVVTPNVDQKLFEKLLDAHHTDKSRLLTTPLSSLRFRFGSRCAWVLFVASKHVRVNNSEGNIGIDHLWKIPSGFALVDDIVTFNDHSDSGLETPAEQKITVVSYY